MYPFLDRQFDTIPDRSMVLNVGAGGEIESKLRTQTQGKKVEVKSLDIDPKRNPDILADLHSWTCDQEFDVVVLAEVLEHCHTPQLAMDKVKSALRPKGKLILTTPFIFPIHDAPYDYYRFTQFGLAHLLTGFEDVTISERNSWSECILVLLVRMVMEQSRWARLFSPFLILIAYILWPVAWFISQAIKLNHMTTGYCVSAVKGEQ